MITIVYFLLYYAVLFVQSWRFRKQKEFEKKNKIRKQMIVIQFLFLFFILFVFITDGLVWSVADENSTVFGIYTNFDVLFSIKFFKRLLWTFVILSPLAFIIMWSWGRLNGLFKGIKTIENVIGTRFILYLRAFEKDKTSYKERLDMMQYRRHENEHQSFIEATFLNILPNVVTVHDPRTFNGTLVEWWTTKGIFLDSKTWEADVEKMIEESQRVFVLVSSRPSCITEINKSLNNLNKVYFIIDDLAEYLNISKVFPLIFHSVENVSTPFCINVDNGALKIWKFKNQVYSYEHLIKAIDSYEETPKTSPQQSHIQFEDCSDKLNNSYLFASEEPDKWSTERLLIVISAATAFFICCLFHVPWENNSLLSNFLVVPIEAFLAYLFGVIGMLPGLLIEWIYKKIKSTLTGKELTALEVALIHIPFLVMLLLWIMSKFN